MAQKIITTLVCDLDGVADGTVTTFRFGVDGKEYEMDLCGLDLEKAEGVFGQYTGAARTAGFSFTKAPGGRGNGRKPARVRNDDRNAKVRSWAKEQGMEVSDRGRIPAGIVAKYDAAH